MNAPPPLLPLRRILVMNAGFLGLQFSFGLQQSNMGPIYSYLGAHEASLPYLTLAGPITGLLVQPVIGALSDRTDTKWGRRVPYFIAGAALCSLCLFAMPFSSSLLIAAVLLWVLDTANNVTMEPYRAYIADRLHPSQRSLGFLTQSAFTGLAQTLAYAAPTAFVALGIFSRDSLTSNGIPAITRAAFLAGAVISISTILWSVLAVPELPLARKPETPEIFKDFADAVRKMPRPMRQMMLMSLCQWYAMMCYWTYVTYAVARALYHTADPASAGFRAAVLTSGQIGAFYNLVACLAAFGMVRLSAKFSARSLHSACLAACGIAMAAVALAQSQAALFAAVIGIGLGWASIMGNPYVIVSGCIPAARTGIYMGIFNMFIVIPMLIFGLTMPLLYGPVFGGDPRHVLLFGAALMCAAAAATQRITAPA